jgi:hypothetical protein
LPSALEPVDFYIHAVVAPFAFVSLVPHTWGIAPFPSEATAICAF